MDQIPAEHKSQMQYVDDQLKKNCTSLFLVDDSISQMVETSLTKVSQVNKQCLMSGKMIVLMSLIEQLGHKG